MFESTIQHCWVFHLLIITHEMPTILSQHHLFWKIYWGIGVFMRHKKVSRSWIESHHHQITYQLLNTLRPRQNGPRFADNTFKRIFLNENVRISIKISQKFVPKGPINNIPALVQVRAWRRSGDKPLSEPMLVSLLTHICVSRPQWIKL